MESDCLYDPSYGLIFEWSIVFKKFPSRYGYELSESYMHCNSPKMFITEEELYECSEKMAKWLEYKKKKKYVDADCKCLETGRHTLGLISATSLVLELQQGHVQPWSFLRFKHFTFKNAAPPIIATDRLQSPSLLSH